MFGTDLKLVNAAPQRWSSMTKVLERVLKEWLALKAVFDGSYPREDERSKFPLKGLRQQLLELYSLMRLVQRIIIEVQGSGYPSSAVGWFDMMMVRKRILSGEYPLLIYDPARYVVYRRWIIRMLDVHYSHVASVVNARVTQLGP